MILLLWACSTPTTPVAAPPVTPAAVPERITFRSEDLAAFKADFYGGKVPVLVDVRTPEEFQAGHVPGARNIPLDQVENRATELDSFKGGPVYLICETGGRSARASHLLATRGYSAVNIQGGTYAWREAGLPLEK